jgi:PAS domain S-box-containing protein
MRAETFESTSVSSAQSAESDDRLRRAQVELLYLQAPVGIYGASAAALMVGFCLWDHVSPVFLAAWCAALVLVYFHRQRLVSAFGKLAPKERDIPVWQRRLIISNMLSATVWGSTAVFMPLLNVSLFHQGFIGLIAICICIASITAYSPLKGAYLPFVFLIMIPIAGSYFFQGDPARIAMGVMALLMMMCLLLIGNRIHAASTESLKIRFRNRDLIDALTESEERTKKLNEELQNEVREKEAAQEALQEAHELLEKKVIRRTADLSNAKQRLEQEVHERRTTEAALRRSEERFRAIFETAEDLMFIKDTDRRYTHVNPAMLRYLDKGVDEMVGKREEDLFDARRSCQARDLEARVLQGQTVEIEHRVRWTEWPATFNFIRFPLYDASGRIVGLCGIAREMSVTAPSERPGSRMTAGDAYSSAAYVKTLADVLRAAETNSIVFFLGESGTGKDYLAHYLHDRSSRADGPFISINCGALSPELVESELFGHEAGAFTGARGRKRGRIELAEGGTLLLNEIGEMPLVLQTKLLDFLDTRSFTRVGGERPVSPNVRILAATNGDIKAAVDEGRFRKDLFFRLNVFTIRVPALRQRKEDISLLVSKILTNLAEKRGLTDLPSLDAGAMAALTHYEWPGNVRELRNVLERALILCNGRMISSVHLGLIRSGSETGSGKAPISDEAPHGSGASLPDALERTKRVMIDQALKNTGGNITRAAARLGISRQSLKHHMRYLHIQR